MTNHDHRLERKKKSFGSYWNQNLLENIIRELGVSQIPFLFQNDQKNQNSGTYSSTSNNLVLTSEKETNFIKTDQLPDHFIQILRNLEKPEIQNLVESLCVYKVNIDNSLLHSILALLDQNYRVSPWETKEFMVTLFRSKLYYDLEMDNKLRQKLKQLRIPRDKIKAELNDKYPSNLLKNFISVYFGINLIIITQEEIELIPTESDQHIPTLLLYQYPFGNVSPILQGNIVSQILIWSKSPLLQAILPHSHRSEKIEKPIPILKKTALHKIIRKKVKDQTEIPSNKESNNKSKDSITGIIKIKDKDKDQKTNIEEKDINREKNDTKTETNGGGLITLEKDFIHASKKLIKYKLEELQKMCLERSLEIRKPAKKINTFKNKTKQELVDTLLYSKQFNTKEI